MTEFVDEIPDPTSGHSTIPAIGHEKLTEFANELRRRPGNWARWPRSFPTFNAAGTCRSKVRRGHYMSFQPPEDFEIVQRKFELYIRYVGNMRK